MTDELLDDGTMPIHPDGQQPIVTVTYADDDAVAFAFENIGEVDMLRAYMKKVCVALTNHADTHDEIGMSIDLDSGHIELVLLPRPGRF